MNPDPTTAAMKMCAQDGVRFSTSSSTGILHEIRRDAPLPLVVGILLLGLLACGGPETQSPLIEALHEPLVLTEGARIALPASKDGNRFIKGWRDGARRQAPRLHPVGVARIQVVHLEQRPRQLMLRATVRPLDDGEVEYRVGHQAWQSTPLAPSMVFPIPPDLDLGRFTFDLRLPAGNELSVHSFTLSDPKPAGQVEVTEEGDLLQSGYSVAEVARRFDGRAAIEGTFRPPAPASTGQKFWLELETSQGTQVLSTWEQGKDSDSEKTFSASVDGGYGRLRFFAQGTGLAAEWRDLTVREREAVRSEATSPPLPPKLVVLYVMDALRTDHVGHLGGPQGISPTLDRLASEGTTFVNHFSVAPNTVPSTKSLFTGKKFLLKGGQKLGEESGPTLAQRFYAAGFRTGLFSGNGNVSSYRGMTRGFESRSWKVLWRGKKSREQAGYNNNAEAVHSETLDWLDTLDPSDRSFVHIQTIHPHNPYDPPEPFLSRFVPDNGSTISGSTATLKGIRAKEIKIDLEDQQRLEALYAASVAYNDAHIEELLRQVLTRYDEEEVLFILTSDHGEELFEHGGVLHGYTLYDEMLHIPLVVWWPGTVGHRRVDAMTDNVDLHATLATLVPGDEGEAPIEGDSLWPYMVSPGRGEDSDRKVVFAAAASVEGGIFMARSERYKVIYAPRLGSRGGGRWGMGQGLGRGFDAEYVFDLEADLQEKVNLAGEPHVESDWLWQQLMSWIEVGTRLESGEELGEIDEATRESLRALGYIP